MSRVLKDTDFAIPCCYTQAGSTNIINTADTVVEVDTVQVASTAYSLSAGEITANQAGVYHISYSIPVNDDGSSGTSRGRVFGWVENNSVVIPQSHSQCYARELSGGEGMSTSFTVTLSASDIVRLVVRSSSTVDVSSEAGEAQISIHRLSRIPT